MTDEDQTQELCQVCGVPCDTTEAWLCIDVITGVDPPPPSLCDDCEVDFDWDSWFPNWREPWAK